MTADEMHEVFAEWNKGELDSLPDRDHARHFAFKDDDGKPLVDKILDTAGQKGTGKWTVDQLAGTRHPDHADRRGRLRALPVCAEGRTRRGLEKTERARDTIDSRRPRQVHRGHPPRALLLEDHLLRAGLHADARRGQGIQAGT